MCVFPLTDATQRKDKLEPVCTTQYLLDMQWVPGTNRFILLHYFPNLFVLCLRSDVLMAQEQSIGH